MLKSLVLPLLATLGLHTFLVLVFVVDWSPEPRREVRKPPSFVKAKVVTMKAVQSEKKAPKKKKTPPRKPRAEEAERKKREAQQRIEREKREQAERARREKERRAREKAQREKQAQKEKRRLEEQRRRELRERQQRELAAAMKAEEQALQSEGDRQLAANYQALIKDAVENNWSRPPSARNNMKALLEIHLVPTGEVVSVTIVESSGNAAFDRSAEQAVKKAARFPELQDLPPRVFEKFFRQFKLKFNPEDLRR